MSDNKKHADARNKKHIYIILAIAVVAVIAVIVILAMCNGSENKKEITPAKFSLDNGIEIVSVGKYAGEYMEDGTDEVVSNVLMIVVRNTSERTLQYAEISLKADGKEAVFNISTLPPGEEMVALEKNRTEYVSEDEYKSASINKVAIFDKEPTLYENIFEISAADGILNVKNISDKDIDGDVFVYYKNVSDNMYYGGITYRARISGGISAGDTEQIMARHYTLDGSKVLFITYAE